MFKRFFYSNNESEFHSEEAPENPPGVPNRVASVPPPAPRKEVTLDNSGSFDGIYETAAVRPPRSSFGILKVAEMADSPHLAGMSTELKRNSILMALEAAGADVDYLLEDAVFRQRALNEREDRLKEKVEEFEAAKSREIAEIQEELARITAEKMSRIQNNVDEIAKEQERLHVWQARKQAESNRIADTAMYFAPKSNQPAIKPVLASSSLALPGNPAGDIFSALLDRGAMASRH